MKPETQRVFLLKHTKVLILKESIGRISSLKLAVSKSFTSVKFQDLFPIGIHLEVRGLFVKGGPPEGPFIYPLQKRLFTLSLLTGKISLSSENSNFIFRFGFYHSENS